MIILLTFIHVVACLFLIIVVLLQSGKAADLAGAFGGMGSQTAFGPRGSATLLSKATTGAAVIFMLTSLTLAIMASRHAGVGTTVLEERKAPVSTAPQKGAAPVAPGGQIPIPTPKPGQPPPTVTLTPQGGVPGKPIPLDLNKLPRMPAQQQQQPAPKK